MTIGQHTIIAFYVWRTMGKLYVIAELLLAEGARAVTHTLENLVTLRSEKFWLSRDCPYVRRSVRPCANTSKTKRVHVAPLVYRELL